MCHLCSTVHSCTRYCEWSKCRCGTCSIKCLPALINKAAQSQTAHMHFSPPAATIATTLFSCSLASECWYLGEDTSCEWVINAKMPVIAARSKKAQMVTPCIQGLWGRGVRKVISRCSPCYGPCTPCQSFNDTRHRGI
jgi:hypothetical protein